MGKSCRHKFSLCANCIANQVSPDYTRSPSTSRTYVTRWRAHPVWLNETPRSSYFQYRPSAAVFFFNRVRSLSLSAFFTSYRASGAMRTHFIGNAVYSAFHCPFDIFFFWFLFEFEWTLDAERMHNRRTWLTAGAPHVNDCLSCHSRFYFLLRQMASCAKCEHTHTHNEMRMSGGGKVHRDRQKRKVAAWTAESQSLVHCSGSQKNQ